MNRLSIGIPSSIRGQDIKGSIDISHLVAREARVDKEQAALGISPGVLVVIPLDGALQLLFDSEAFDVPQGVVLVMSGESRKVIMPALSREDSDEGGTTFGIIEINALLNSSAPFRERLELPCLLDYGSSERVAGLFAQLSASVESGAVTPSSVEMEPPLTAALLVTTLLAAAGKPRDETHSPAANEKLLLLKQFLIGDLSRKLTISDMASHLAMSRSAFFTWSRTMLGCTPAKYLKQLRLERSQELIAQRAGSIEEIAEQTGFAHRYHLSEEFKKHFGVTPARYRKMSRADLNPDFLDRVSATFRDEDYQKALAVCEQGLRSSPPAILRDRLRHQKGRCLQALGRTLEAMAEWKALEGSSSGHVAGMARIRQLFQAGETDLGLDIIRGLYAAEDATQRRDVVRLWMEHVIALRASRQPGPLRRCLALRRELFAANLTSMSLAMEVSRALGENMDLPVQCAARPFPCFMALRRAGETDQAIEQYGQQVPARARVEAVKFAGRYEEVLTMPEANPAQIAVALIELGRPQEVLDRYPDQGETAYLALGRYEELLEYFPEETLGGVYALHALGQTKKLKHFPMTRPWLWIEAQLYSYPEAILRAEFPDARMFSGRARLLIALHELSAGNRAKAEDVIGRIDGIRAQDLWWEDHDGTELLLVSVVRGLLGDPAQLHDDLAEIVAHHKFKDKQRFWHDAAYLNGTLDEAMYLRQPLQHRLGERLMFVQAVANDIHDRTDAACRLYRQFIESSQPYGIRSLLSHRFAEWRLHVL